MWETLIVILEARHFSGVRFTNRKPEQWKRNRDMMYTKDKDNDIVVNIIRKGANDSEEDEDWTASASTDVKKSKAKKAKPEPDDLNYWPDD